MLLSLGHALNLQRLLQIRSEGNSFKFPAAFEFLLSLLCALMLL